MYYIFISPEQDNILFKLYIYYDNHILLTHNKTVRKAFLKFPTLLLYCIVI
jgi:hypothetical protein